MLRAALTSRSCSALQTGHVQTRTLSGRVSTTCPQEWHVLLLGKNRSTLMKVRPRHSDLYSSCRTNSDHPASEMARESDRSLTIPRTLRSSTTIAWFSRTSRVLSLWRWSRRLSATRACRRARLMRALSLFFDPFVLCARRRDRIRLRASSRASCLGLATLFSVERVTRFVMPRSMPTAVEDAGSLRMLASSQRNDMCHRPEVSRLTVTVDGCTPFGSGRLQRTSMGTSILASISAPFSKRKALRENSAEPPRLLRLKLGYFARLPKKLS